MKLKEIREKEGYSQRELALKTGLAPQNMSRYESGQVEPNIETLIKLADFLHVTLDELVGRPTNLLNKLLLTEREQTLIDKILAMNEKQQELTELYIDTMLNNLQETYVRKKTIYDYIALIKEGKAYLAEAENMFKKGTSLVNDGQAGLITYIMAMESAKRYKEENKNKVPQLLEEELEMTYKGIKIHKTKNCATWYTRFRKNGKQHYISARTQKECLELLKKRLNEKDEFDYNTTTLTEWITIWLNTYKKNKVRESTFNAIQYLIKNHFKGTIFKKKLTDIRPIEIETYLNELKFDRVKENAYVYLKDAFNKALNNGIIRNNPLNTINKPTHEKAVKKALTIDEQAKFEEKCLSDEKYYLLLVCLWEGLRLGELRALEKADLDFINRKITINKSINDVGSENLTKNKYSNRVIPMFEKTYNLLINYNSKTNRLFYHTKNYISKILNEVLNELKIENITMHSLRHTFITRCQEKNIPLYIIQNWVGHVQGSTVTSKIYTHIQNEAELQYIHIVNQ